MLSITDDEKRQSAVIQVKRSFQTLQTQAEQLRRALDVNVLGVPKDELRKGLGSDYDLVIKKLDEFLHDPHAGSPALHDPHAKIAKPEPRPRPKLVQDTEGVAENKSLRAEQ